MEKYGKITKQIWKTVGLYLEFSYERSRDKSLQEACLETGLQRKSFNTSNKTRVSLLALPPMSRKTHVAATRLAKDEKDKMVLLRFGTGSYERLPTYPFRGSSRTCSIIKI